MAIALKKVLEGPSVKGRRGYRKAVVTNELKATVGRIEQLCDKFNAIVKEMNEDCGSKGK